MHARQPRAPVRPVVFRFNPFVLPLKPRPGQRGQPGSAAIIRLLPGARISRQLTIADGPGPVLGRLDSLEVRLATTGKEVRQAQHLRYRVFYEEMSAVPNAAAMLARRDKDEFDAACDHILVLDHACNKNAFRPTKPEVVGTYRLLRQEVADRHFGFYTAGEFDVALLIGANPGLRFLELGRSCVLKPYRTKRTIELLWHGIWAYVLHHRIDAMIGCASLDGTDPARLALPLSFLHHYARAPEPWRVHAAAGRGVAMDRLPKHMIDVRAAMQALPPLLKGYLRIGAMTGEGAVVDRQFGTTDVLVVLPVSAISQRYIAHFGPTADRHAA